MPAHPREADMARASEAYARRRLREEGAQPGDIYGTDGRLIGRTEISDREFLAPLLEEEAQE